MNFLAGGRGCHSMPRISCKVTLNAGCCSAFSRSNLRGTHYFAIGLPKPFYELIKISWKHFIRKKIRVSFCRRLCFFVFYCIQVIYHCAILGTRCFFLQDSWAHSYKWMLGLCDPFCHMQDVTHLLVLVVLNVQRTKVPHLLWWDCPAFFKKYNQEQNKLNYKIYLSSYTVLLWHWLTKPCQQQKTINENLTILSQMLIKFCLKIKLHNRQSN